MAIGLRLLSLSQHEKTSTEGEPVNTTNSCREGPDGKGAGFVAWLGSGLDQAQGLKS